MSDEATVPTGEAVTVGDTALETARWGAVSAEAPRIEGHRARVRAREGRPAGDRGSRARLRRLWDVAIGDWPSVWSESPTAPAGLVRYAAAGDWCAPEARWWRLAGRLYCALLAIPVSVVLYTAAWLVQRPGRVVAAVVLAAVVWAVL